MTILSQARAYFQAPDAEPVTVQQLSERFGCSGNVMRKALQMLCHLGECERIRRSDQAVVYAPVRIPVGEARELGTVPMQRRVHFA